MIVDKISTYLWHFMSKKSNQFDLKLGEFINLIF